MKRFDFPLERVRRWRLEQQNVEELKLQQLRAELGGLTAVRREMQQHLSRSAEQVLAQATVQASELESLASFRLYVRGRIRAVELREREYEQKIEGQRQRVIEARQRFQMLDHLRKTAFGEWRAAVDKEYETLAAEMFLAKARRA